jgi:hypothetical protein
MIAAACAALAIVLTLLLAGTLNACDADRDRW